MNPPDRAPSRSGHVALSPITLTHGSNGKPHTPLTLKAQYLSGRLCSRIEYAIGAVVGFRSASSRPSIVGTASVIMSACESGVFLTRKTDLKLVAHRGRLRAKSAPLNGSMAVVLRRSGFTRRVSLHPMKNDASPLALTTARKCVVSRTQETSSRTCSIHSNPSA